MSETDRSGHPPGKPKTPPGPDGYPVVGNVLSLADDAFAFYEELAEHGDVARYRVFGQEGYAVTHPDAIREVLVDDHERYCKGDLPNDKLGSLLGDGLFLAEGESWRTQRQAMQPAFFREQVERYGDAVVEHARTTADGWDDGEVVAVDDAASTLTLRVLASTLLGIGTGSDGERETVRRAAAAITDRYDSSRLGSYLPEWLPTPTNRRYRRSLADLHDLVDRQVAARRAGEDAGEDLLSMLVGAADAGAFDDDTLRDNVVTFLFAGYETSALGLTYTLYLLAANPGVQQRLQDRLDDVLDGDDPTPADLGSLPLLDAVVDEALRLYPPVYTFFREPTEDVTLRGYQIPEGSVLSLPQWVVHRDERWWDAPASFRPERWLEESDRPEYAYFPFGGGPRHCIGMRFARLELRLAVATLLSRCRLAAVTESLALVASANARPAEPVRLRIRKR